MKLSTKGDQVCERQLISISKFDPFDTTIEKEETTIQYSHFEIVRNDRLRPFKKLSDIHPWRIEQFE